MKKIFVCALVSALSVFANDVEIKSVSASSTLPNQGNNNYDVKNLVDQNLESIWAASFEGSPVSIELDVEAYEVNELKILNGYRRDRKSYENNSRAKKINIYADSKENLVKSVTLTDYPWDYCMGLEDPKERPKFLKAMGMKASYKEPYSEMCYPLGYTENVFFKPAIRGVKKLIVEVESVYPGKKWKDLCLTEVSVGGYAKSPLLSNFVPETGSVEDTRDGRTYKTMKVDGKEWMSENLNYASKGSSCYEKDGKDCSKKGRVYKESVAKNDLCPTGWRLPTADEFSAFSKYFAALSPEEFRFLELFDEDRSSNSFGMNFYNLDGMWRCEDNDGDASIFGKVYDRFHKKDGSAPNETAFWIQPVKNPLVSTLESKTFVRFNYQVGVMLPGGDFPECMMYPAEKHREEFFVRCVKE